VGAVAIVTGGASGIGRALGEALVGRGDTVMLGDVDEALDRVANEVSHRGPGTAVPIVVDVRDAAAVRTMVELTQRDHGRVDLMFNNAGVGVAGEVDELSLEHWNRALDVNVRGVIHGVHAVYPLMPGCDRDADPRERQSTRSAVAAAHVVAGEVAGLPEEIQQALPCVRPRGRCISRSRAQPRGHRRAAQGIRSVADPACRPAANFAGRAQEPRLGTPEHGSRNDLPRDTGTAYDTLTMAPPRPPAL